MADAYVGEIRIFAGNFAPVGWAFCNGQLLSIQQNTALFSILGTMYGGDGKSTFALPDMTEKAPMQQGAGPGLSSHSIGEESGIQYTPLETNEIPLHNHAPNAVAVGNENVPTNGFWAGIAPGRSTPDIYATAPDAQMNPQAIEASGGSQPHNNMQPFLGVSFIIAMQGEFPSRS